MRCSEANVVCDKAQYKEASLCEKIKMHFHLAMCKLCRQYTKNNLKLTKLINTNRTENFQRLDENLKRELKTTFDEALAKHRNK